MANLGNYDATNGETMGDRSVLPPGEYIIAMVKSDRTQAKANPNNSYIACEFEITDGQHKSRRLWTNLNLWNDNAQAVDIAQRELNSIMHACGRLRVSDTEELHGIPMRATVVIDKNDATRNRIRGYQPLNGAPASQRQQSQPAGNAGGGGGSSSAPWKRSA